MNQRMSRFACYLIPPHRPLLPFYTVATLPEFTLEHATKTERRLRHTEEGLLPVNCVGVALVKTPECESIIIQLSDQHPPFTVAWQQ
jgi:hypothetical protein